MARTETVKDVPASKVDQVVEDFKLDGADPVVKQKQPNGKYTVIATYAEEDEEDGV